MRLRSLLFVPGDRPERFAKAAASGADAIILDLEDSVSLANKEAARSAVADYLSGTREVITLVRVNPLDGRSEEHTSELQSLMRISYAVFCLKKKKNNKKTSNILLHTYIQTTKNNISLTLQSNQ